MGESLSVGRDSVKSELARNESVRGCVLIFSSISFSSWPLGVKAVRDSASLRAIYSRVAIMIGTVARIEMRMPEKNQVRWRK